MSKKFNNRYLLIVLIVLIGIFTVARMTKYKKSNRTLNTEIVSIDTSRVTAMHLFPSSEKGAELIFKKEGGSWRVSKGDVSAPADRAAIENALSELLNDRTEQLVARTADKWGDYSVTDSMGTRILIKEGKKSTLDIVIGRFDYKQAQNPYGGYGGYGQNQGIGITYVRNSTEDEVYAVQGFLAMSLNRNFQSWRDQTITSFAPAQLSKIVFEYPADSGFIAQKSGTGWMVGGLQADSASMASYLNRVSRKRGAAFMDGFQTSAQPEYMVTFEGENMLPLHVKAYTQPDGTYVFHSSVNPESWFNVSSGTLFSDMFKSAGELLPTE